MTTFEIMIERETAPRSDGYDRISNTIMIDGIHTGYSAGKPGPIENRPR